ncbi:SWIB/MDM2 domain-containing protein [Colletotrichum scovillei]|nr:SWIB/MDM2 domain-containing protein [Colletotrichum scovillei]
MQPQYRQYAAHAGAPQVPQRAPHAPNQRRGGIGPIMPPSHHAQAAMNQAAMAQHHPPGQALTSELAKRRSRKPTDKTLPDGVDECITDTEVAQRYKDLRDFERRLDAAMTRKRLDIVETVGRNAKHYKTLRIWISNTVEDQAWQGSGLSVDSFDFTPSAEPSYRVKIEGRLLEDGSDDASGETDQKTESAQEEDATGSRRQSSAPVNQKHRLSHFFKALNVDFDRTRSRAASDQTVEWKKPASQGAAASADFDEFTFKRSGDENMNITINLHRQEDPERYLLSPELADVVDMTEASRQEVVLAIWDDAQPTIYDVRVAVDDPLRAKLVPFVTTPAYASALKEVVAMDEQLATLISAVASSKAKHSFFTSMSQDPANFVRNWMSSQKRDLEIIMGEATRGGGEDATGDDWRRGGRDSVWTTSNARESVSVMLAKQAPQASSVMDNRLIMASFLVPGNTAVITGGASGIGLAIAKKCVSHGMKVLVVDRDTKLLQAAKTVLGETSTTFELDVSLLQDWETLKTEVNTSIGGHIDLLVLNAGIGGKSSWLDTDSFRKILDTNLYGVINGISSLLPFVGSGQSSKSAIVITGSKQGITNPPGNPAYNASKAAVKSLAEHLSFDLKDTATSVHLLVPGWTFTGLAGAAPGREKPAAAWTAEEVAEYLEKKMTEGLFYILCPDNEVTEEMDRKRMMWSVGDIVEGRPPLSRWRNDYKDEAQAWMAKR